jgi:tRNA pseudouridine38-40 synthase
MAVRWRATLEYDGGGFAGWQVQPGARTLQAAVDEALSRMAGHEVRCVASGRTDAGVHAAAQVISFDLDVARGPDNVRDALNARLPEDVACLAAEVAPVGFDARRWVLDKRYRYTFLARRARSALLAHRAWHVRAPLDVPSMDEAARVIVGRHDMSAFRAAGCGATHPVRTVYASNVVAEGDLVHLDVVGNGFLRHMVRNIAGALHEVGRGKRPASWMTELLASRDRRNGALTAPAHGLMLMEVRYGDGPAPWKAVEADDGLDEDP